jgi:organic hydroperoxide reductase OsmC/OhrA
VTREHTYRMQLEWTGNQGSGTSNYRAYGRDHVIRAPHKPVLLGSSDPAFRGDPTRWTPEELLLVSVAQCHMLWYLHLCAQHRVVVTAYRDDPIGVMVEETDGAGQFVGITLRPTVEVRDPEMCISAELLHAEVGAKCFIARSVNFPITHQVRVTAR